MDKKELISLQIGSGGIKLLHVDPSSSVPKVLNSLIVDCKKLEEEEGLSDTEVLVNRLKEAVERLGVHGMKCDIVLSGGDVVIRYKEFPVLSEIELSSHVRHAVKGFSPYPVEESYISHTIVDRIKTEKSDQILAMIVVARKAQVDRDVTVAREAGLEVRRVTVTALCLASIARMSELDNSGHVCICEIGHETSSLSIFEDGKLRFSREVPMAGSAIDELIAKALSEDQKRFVEQLPDAVKLKKELGIVQEDKLARLEEREKAAAEMIIEGASRLVQRIRLSIGYFKTQAKIQKVSQLIITGGTAYLKGLDKYLEAELEMPVKVLDLERQLDFPEDDGDMTRRGFVVNGGMLAILAGAATDTRHFDLLPARIVEKNTWKDIENRLKSNALLAKVVDNATYAAAAIWIVVILIVGFHWSRARINVSRIERDTAQYNERNRNISAMQQVIEDMIEKRGELLKKQSFIDTLQEPCYRPYGYLAELTEVLPPQIMVREIDLDYRASSPTDRTGSGRQLIFRMNAESTDLEMVNLAVSNMKDSYLFDEVNLESTRFLEDAPEGGMKLAFVVRGTLHQVNNDG